MEILIVCICIVFTCVVCAFAYAVVEIVRTIGSIVGIFPTNDWK